MPFVAPPMPSELQEAFLGQQELQPIFDGLSALRQNAYIEWVASADDEAERRDRADLVCTVLRVLACPEATTFDPWATLT